MVLRSVRSFFILFLLFGITFAGEALSVEATQLYHTAEPYRLRKTFEDAIINAKESILILTFTFSDQNFIKLINQKADEGVEVIVVIDKDHRGPLLTSGNDKIQVVTRFHGEGRVHHKILVVDDEDVWMGSANFSTAAFTSQENLVVGVKSTVLAQALRSEVEVFQGMHKRTDSSVPQDILGEQELLFYLLPHFDPHYAGPEKLINERGKEELLSLIKNANSHIKIAMMVWTDPELEKAILEAHRRGIVVEVLLQDMQDTVSWNLKAAGVFVTINPRLNFMHNKWMWIDEDILVNGSANWSRSSFSRNDESFIVLKNLSENQKIYLKDYWTDLLTRSTRSFD
ncbi:MAG: phosphatidylserine/phosphatidylglycerophosphate/cardiolipin synthase family protein [Chlamydiia bacterium]|nr:phosphatidylserine/phosphatidylglycerophosphate/cardiolipin synthase family protein [Chlamydiia bacterium]